MTIHNVNCAYFGECKQIRVHMYRSHVKLTRALCVNKSESTPCEDQLAC